ncbi:carboxypeptidase-like regulatory domain-containing protein [Hymenobacter sp. 5317J-9]|uniref:carboxypeptidase-like regulatory domain-containing protein n=1 Tax=Hymenobacter sp. 5317J-9 TaxID=2932250 RepID=UPI001FD6F186|nr:carboxypeptidase-like regulatory domain-containing protein [Hymenobacter sp. 5317J-9]UOQ98644.1 carboxypeptidase-like regulatory domain-containing protein [Hymenobacter sp. 5317J-9]
MRPTVSLTVPQPCHESWDAMTPAAQGRHCAACQKTVVDFTLKTDAEILAYLATAAGGPTCGRFAAGQLKRPLQRAVPAAPMARWRAWLAAAVAVWGVREAVGTSAQAQTPQEWRARYWGGPVPAAPMQKPRKTPAAEAKTAGAQPISHAASQEATTGAPMLMSSFPDQLPPQPLASLVLRGLVTDSISGEPIPGVTVLINGTTVGTSTDKDGLYSLAVPTELASKKGLEVKVASVGFVSQFRTVATQSGMPMNFRLQADMKTLGEVVIAGGFMVSAMPPAPWHPRALWGWGKYWVMRPFRR